MFAFPNLDTSTIFPIPEGTNLEFKIGFTSSMADKITATICGILNSGGGYLVIGVEDETRRIVGIKTDKHFDNFLLMIDSIYHHSHIKYINGTTIPVGTITSGVVNAANSKQLLVITMNPSPGEKYCIKDGTIWYRLSASNYKQTTLPTVYTEKELDSTIQYKVASHSSMLHQQFELEKQAIIHSFQTERDKIYKQYELEKHQRTQTFQSERDKLIKRFKELERDFVQVVETVKKSDNTCTEYRNALFDSIQQQIVKEEERCSKKNNYSIFSFIMSCFH